MTTISPPRRRRKGFRLSPFVRKLILSGATAAAGAAFATLTSFLLGQLNDPKPPERSADDVEAVLVSATAAADAIEEVLAPGTATVAQRERVDDAISDVLTKCAGAAALCADADFVELLEGLEARDGRIPAAQLPALWDEANEFIGYLRGRLDEDPPYEDEDLCCSDSGTVDHGARRRVNGRAPKRPGASNAVGSPPGVDLNRLAPAAGRPLEATVGIPTAVRHLRRKLAPARRTPFVSRRQIDWRSG